MCESNGGWDEMIEKTINFGREDRSSKFKKIKQGDSQYERYRHCSHVMIFARTNSDFEGFRKKASILESLKKEAPPNFYHDSSQDNNSQMNIFCFPDKPMQMRYDGYIGFPGGEVDDQETPLQALCREIKEEVGWSEKKGAISDSDYVFTHVDDDNELVLHFYVKEVTEAKLNEIENNLVKAPDYGSEVLGHFRIPLYTMGDAFRGFPAFLRNHFVGNAKLQLIEAITHLKLLTEEQIVQALHSAPRITY